MSLPTARVAVPTAPTGLLAVGLVLAWVDVWGGGIDVLPDVLGCALVVVALRRLLPALPGVRTARALVGVAAVLSLADLVHPVRTTTTTSGDGLTTSSRTAAVAPEDLLGVLSASASLVLAVAVVLVCVAIARAAAARGELSLAHRFRVLAWWGGLTDGVLAVLGLAAFVGAGGTGQDAGGWTRLLLVVVVAGLAFSVALLASLWQLRSWPLLVPAVSQLPHLG